MIDTVIHSKHGITLVGGGEIGPGDLAQALAHAPTLVAADGGARFAVQNGHMPQAVIGDFDSIDRATRATLSDDICHPVAEQDSTDFEKCLLRCEAPLFLGVGFMGLRRDHELAAFNALIRWPQKRCILIGMQDIVFAAPQEIGIEAEVGTRFSLFPMVPVRGRSEGLKWPIETVDFAPDGRVGTSNEVAGPVRLRFERAGMLVIMPRAALVPAIAALGDATGFRAR